MGDPFFDLGNFSINHELTPDAGRPSCCAAYDGGEPRRDRLARLTLMRVVSDFREAMWGVLQQGISTLDVDFVGVRRRAFRSTARERVDAGVRARAARGRPATEAAGRAACASVSGSRRPVSLKSLPAADEHPVVRRRRGA